MQGNLKTFMPTLLFFAALACTPKTEKTMIHAHTNSLANQTSPYLLQHAHNPVQWYAWGDEALEKAQKENKLLLISIGYSSCHWCHVMAHECFENDSVAAVMNQYYVNVKIDREERPDLDNYYMGALQLMTGQGGWPLNIIALPDGRPVWGATYVPKEKWVEALQTINNLYKTDPDRVVEYADNLAAGIAQSEQIAPLPPQTDFTTSFLAEAVTNWKTRFDNTDGGPNKAPKFPLPANYTFLLRYGFLADDEIVADHVNLTLKKMALGGIYDQIGGGFARYSVDAHWKVPHFEKMLYDNAQLISLYSEAYKKDKIDLYKEVVSQSLSFLNREMRGTENQYFSALDADTEGEEGKYYTWQKPELQALIAQEEWPIFEKYYNINTTGFWEHGQYILLRTQTDEDFAQENKISILALRGYVNGWQKTLLAARQKRTAPGLDHKALTAWNALTISALVDAYTAFGEKSYLDDALKTAHFISQKMTKKDGALWHTYTTGEAKINGFLDDYAFTISAYLKLYGATADVSWLEKAELHTQFVLQHFDAGANTLFYFTAKEDAFLSRSLESSDNVIPASNSVMAHNLHTMGVLQNRPEYAARAKTMLGQITDQIPRYAEGYGNWASLFLQFAYPSYEVAICGPKAKQYYLQMQSQFVPNALFVFTEKPSDAPLFKDRFVKDGNTYIYVCQDYACKLPVATVAEALLLLK